MEAQKVDMYLMSNAKFFEGHQISMVRDRLVTLDDSRSYNHFDCILTGRKLRN